MADEGAPLANRLGSYELIRPLAHGGMADIYLARRVGPGLFERHVAIKVLNSQRASDAEACAMFLDEARLVAMLNHQNIASVLEVDVVDGRHYLAMEFVHGADLREVLAVSQHTESPLPRGTALSIVCAAAAGLDHAHRKCGPDGKPLRLVHRDVSLSNIMIGHDGSVKVVDFGIATTTIASVHTSPGVVRGKASYMSPEQCLGDPIDHRSDVFALGVVLYELTTGLRCFQGRSDFDRMLAVVRNDFVAPCELDPDYPSELELVIRTALSPDPAERYGSAAAMVEALERVAAAHGWSIGPGGIQRLMRGLFGEICEPWTLHADDAPVTERSVMALSAITEPTRPQRRLSRASESYVRDRPDLFCAPDAAYSPTASCDAVGDDLDERTRGRGPLRRPSRSHLAA